MKSIIKRIILLAALFVTAQINGQTVSTTNTLLEDLFNDSSTPIVSTGVDVLNLANGNYQDAYIQGFGYYNNPEINKLENEVSLLGNVYTRERYGRKPYSSDKYQNLTDEEKKNFRSASSSYFRYTDRLSSKNSEAINRTQDQIAEEFFNKTVAPNLNSDGSVNKQKLSDEIRRRLNTLFEMKESEKQKEVTKLENQLKALQSTLAERKKNKQQIIEQRMNEIVGLPNTLRW